MAMTGAADRPRFRAAAERSAAGRPERCAAGSTSSAGKEPELRVASESADHGSDGPRVWGHVLVARGLVKSGAREPGT